MTLATLPPAHAALLVIRRAISRLHVAGTSVNDALAVIASDSTLFARILTKFFGDSVLERKDHLVVAVLSGGARQRFLHDIKFDGGHIPESCFALLTAPNGDEPRLSIVRVRLPQLTAGYARKPSTIG